MSGNQFSGSKNRYNEEYQLLLQRRDANTITPLVFNSRLQNLTRLQIRYDQAKAKRQFRKQQEAEFNKILLKEQEKEAEKVRKAILKQQADLIARQEVERVRIEREAKEAKRKAKKSMKSVLNEIIKPRAIPFERLGEWSSIRIPNKPFTLTLKSGIANITRHFNFHSKEHFQNWLASIENQNTKEDSANYQSYAEAIGTDENIFDTIIPSIVEVQGGCKSRGKETDTIVTPFYDISVYSPITNHNNCGFKVIEYLLKIKLNYAEERKKYNIPYESQINSDILYQIYQQYSTKILNIIDKSFDSVFDFKNYDYIFIDNQHYYAVKTATAKNFTDKKTKRGYIFWDIETRPSENYVMVGNTKSYILKPTILCAYYTPYKSEHNYSLTLISNSSKDCCRQFLDWLTTESMNGRFYHCIAHNGSRFDNYFLLSQLSREEQLHTETQLRGYSLIGIQYKSHLFKDSCCFLVASLESLCKSYKVKNAKITSFQYNGETLSNKNICFYKPELSYHEFMNLQNVESEFWKYYTEYCLMDCISLHEIWTAFRQSYNNLVETIFSKKPELLKNVRLEKSNTIGSTAKGILENSCLCKVGTKYVKTKPYKAFLEFNYTEGKEDVEKINFINGFKRGGISHTNQAGKHTHELISYDIASQYPASMMHMSIPSGKSEWVTSFNKLKHGYYHLQNLKFSSPHTFKPVASKLESGVLNWNNNEINDINMDSFMIKYLMQNYGLESFDVVKGLVSNHYIKGKEIFGDYVETLYNEKKRQDSLKKKNDDEYNPALRECIKLFLNSLSGKLVEDPSNYFKIQYTGQDTKLKLNGLNTEKIVDEFKYNTWVSAGVMVYSYSKRLLFEYVRCLPNDSNDVIHIETDSIYFNKKNNDIFINNIKNYKQKGLDFYPITIGDDLGNVKVEKDTNEISYFLGKKFYCIGDLYKIKGIPLKTIDKYGNDVKLVDESLYEDIYNGKTLVKEFYTMKKSLFSQITYISSHKMTRTIKPAMEYKLYQ